MIRLTRLNGREFVLNCDLIKFIEETPDTVITLVSNDKIVVTDSSEDIVRRSIEFCRAVRAFPVT